MPGDSLLLSTAYLGPIGYFAMMTKYPLAIIEKHENYIKQTFRNRCTIGAANGLLSLTVPVKRGSFHKTHIAEIEIDYSRNWIAVHLRSIVSAYRNTPYFDYYADDLMRIIGCNTQRLLDLNILLTNHIAGILGIPTKIELSTSYRQPDDSPDDLRYSISPKQSDRYRRATEFPVYLQAFADRYPFKADLSIIDLIFNIGPASVQYLNDISKY